MRQPDTAIVMVCAVASLCAQTTPIQRSKGYASVRMTLRAKKGKKMKEKIILLCFALTSSFLYGIDTVTILEQAYPWLISEQGIYFDRKASPDFTKSDDSENNSGYTYLKNIFIGYNITVDITLCDSMYDGQKITIKNNRTNTISSFSGGSVSIFLPGNGIIYKISRGYFGQEIKKYILINNEIIEVSQEFYYLGNSGILKENIDYYTDTSFSQKVGTIEKGNEILVIGYKFISDGFDNNILVLLVKGRIGLVGWYKPVSMYMQNSPIDGITAYY